MTNIKWRDQDVDLLRKQIRNFNRKIDRLTKKGDPQIVAALPPKMSLKTARSEIQTRAQYNKMLKSIGRFTERGSETLIKTKGGVEAPKFEVKELEARVRSINAERRKRREMIGEVQPGNRPLMGRIRDRTLEPKQAPGKVKPKDWEAYKKSVMRQSDPNERRRLDEAYKENYLKRLKQLFDLNKPEERELYDQIVERIESVETAEFVENSIQYEDLYIETTYEPQSKALIHERIDNITRSLYVKG